VSDEIEIRYADETEAQALAPWIERVADALGLTAKQRQRLWVSDKSLIGDFPATAEQVQERLRIPVESSDRVVDVARRLKARGVA